MTSTARCTTDTQLAPTDTQPAALQTHSSLHYRHTTRCTTHTHTQLAALQTHSSLVQTHSPLHYRHTARCITDPQPAALQTHSLLLHNISTSTRSDPHSTATAASYRPGQAHKSGGPKISRQSTHEGGKVVSRMHRPPLPQRKYAWYTFLLEA